MRIPDGKPSLHGQEYAWASYALLRNTNVSGVLLWHEGRVLAARGTLGPAASAADAASALSSLAQVAVRGFQACICDNLRILHGVSRRCTLLLRAGCALALRVDAQSSASSVGPHDEPYRCCRQQIRHSQHHPACDS